MENTQVFFMADKASIDYKVVIHYKPRSRRRIDESEYLVFGASGAVEETDLMVALPETTTGPNGRPAGDEVQNLYVMAVDALTWVEEDNAHLRDLEYEDDEEAGDIGEIFRPLVHRDLL